MSTLPRTRSSAPTDDLFAGGGEMGRRMREYDWASHPLGPPERWPQSLRTIIRIVLTSRYAMWMFWGDGYWFFCNDTYLPTLGIKGEWALGASTKKVWAEVWSAIESRAAVVFGKREATWDEGLRLFLERSGYPEETYHTFSYSPLPDDDGSIGGMLCVVTEETERVIGQRRLTMLRELAAELAQTKTEQDVLAAAQHCLTAHPEDAPFALFYELDPHADSARLVGTHGIEAGHTIAPPTIGGNKPWPVQELATRRETIVTELAAGQTSLPTGPWDRPASRAAVVPLLEPGQARPSGFIVIGLNPYRPYAEPYRGFIQLLAGQISAGLNSARAFEAERKRAAALAEIDRAKTEFFSNVSHEFRTPLTLMLGPLEDELRTRSAGNERIETAYRNALRLLKLVNSLLDFSRSEAGRLQATYTPVDLGTFTRELASSFESLIAKAGLAFRIDSPALPADTWIDREMWEKIIFNLLSNAFKFTFAGEIAISVRPLDDVVEVVVRDTGTGIPAQALPRLFERFHRIHGARSRTYEGSGIGLALVQQLVRLHGGDIRVESAEGEGTTFTLTIRKGTTHLPSERLTRDSIVTPVSNRAAAFIEEASRWIPETSQTGETAPASAARIVLVDDNADMRDYVQRLLAPYYQVVTANDGEAGLAAIRSQLPALVLSDVMMPKLDGFGLLRVVRADPALSAIPFILLSARAGEDARVEGLEHQADDYLVKPFTARELLARIRTHLDLARIRRESQSRVLESEQRLRLAIQAGQLGLWEIDPQTAAVRQDARALAILGRREPAGDLEAALDGVHPEDTERVRFKLARAFDPAGDGRFDDEHRVLVPGTEEVRWVRAAGLVTFEAGQPKILSGTLLDITQIMRARETLAERQNELERLVEERTAELRDTVAELEGFSYSVSHDLRAPLRAMQSFAMLLSEDYAAALDDMGRDYLKRIVNASHRMDQLIHDVLVYSRVARTELALEPVDLDRVIDGVIESHPQLQATAADVTVARPLPSVLANEAALTQCLANLLSNAVKFVAPGTRPRVEIDAEEKAGRVRLRVRDHGIGIPPEFHQKIFGIFERLSRDYEGTGIGLAVVRKAAERMGGDISLESEVGVGSTFTLELAAAR